MNPTPNLPFINPQQYPPEPSTNISTILERETNQARKMAKLRSTSTLLLAYFLLVLMIMPSLALAARDAVDATKKISPNGGGDLSESKNFISYGGVGGAAGIGGATGIVGPFGGAGTFGGIGGGAGLGTIGGVFPAVGGVIGGVGGGAGGVGGILPP